jgi:hypothetical protein
MRGTNSKPKPVRYPPEMSAKAATEGRVLVTFEIFGKYAKQDGATYQGYLLTPEEVERAWQFFEWLGAHRHAERRKSGGAGAES